MLRGFSTGAPFIVLIGKKPNTDAKFVSLKNVKRGDMKDTYLSIDLDFWDCVTWDHWKSESFLIDLSKFRCSVFEKIRNYQIPVEWFQDHHHMLANIIKTNCEHIINMDFHSDLTGDGPLDVLNEGNVFDHIIDSANKTFTWLYPYKDLGRRNSVGRCDHTGADAFLKKNWIYKKQQRTVDRSVIPWDRIKRIGICLSPDWVGSDTYYFIQNDLPKELFSSRLHSIFEKSYRLFQENQRW